GADTNGVSDVFVRSNGATSRVSVATGGAQANGSSYAASMSSDGNLVLFESVASNLVANDTNGVADIFLHNRATGETKRVSTSPFGEQAIPNTNGHLSPNGKYVAFQSAHTFTNIQASAGRTAIYRYHVDTGAFDLLTRSGERPQDAASRPSFDPTAADDGSVAFISRARNLVLPAEGDGTPQASADDVYVVRIDGSVLKASVNSAGEGANDDSYEPSISADGQHVAFISKANNLGGAVSGTTQDLYVRNLAAGTTRLVSTGAGGAVPTGSSFAPAINANGTLVAFASNAENLVSGDGSGTQDVFLANLANNGMERVSVRPGVDGFQPNGASYTPAVSADGLIVAFHSLATNLMDGDTNNAYDTFVRDLAGQLPQPCTTNCGPGGGGGVGGGSGLGYRFVAADGGIFAFESGFHGSMGDKVLNRPIAGMAATPSNNGYWLVATDGGIFSFGDASFQGSTGALRLNSPIVGMASTPSGNGYWFVAADGGIFSFGDAGFHGSMGGKPLNRPIVGMAATKSGKGYWLVASDGGIFSFGDAEFHGSTGALSLNKPIVGMDRTSSGNGYRFVASDGGIFSFGDASFLGSMGDKVLNKPIVGMAKSRVGDGYWLVASDGGIFAFGSAPFFGSTGALTLNSPIVGMAG
ncbi:MAG TPA: hypothetical protein VI854_04160, partial [Acidimicrobiia bacterium]|nr:hypothetical protein [Acidimicrobiia bacterium]